MKLKENASQTIHMKMLHRKKPWDQVKMFTFPLNPELP